MFQSTVVWDVVLYILSVIVMLAFFISFTVIVGRCQEKKEIIIRNREVQKLEQAMTEASNQSLKNARCTLFDAGFHLEADNIVFPPFLWDVHDSELIARTLVTCAKLFEEIYQDCWPGHFYINLWEEMLKFLNTKPQKTLSILLSIGILDRNVVEWMKSANDKRLIPYIQG
jgi:hypothetical protein